MKINASSQPPVRIRAVGKALPKHYASQETLISVFRDAWAGAHYNPERLEELHRSVQVAGRYLALPLEAYRELKSFAARNEAWTRAAVDLGEGAIRKALEKAGLLPTDVDHLVFVTTTGLEALHRSVQVAGRYLALPLEAYRELKSFAARNEAWTRAANDFS